MGFADLFDDPADSTRAGIMRATYVALAKHGYADLTIQRIADEFEKSKSLLYHHYDGKDALLVDFMEFLVARFEAGIEASADADPRARLEQFFEWMAPLETDDDRYAFDRVLVELRAAAAHKPRFREQFTRTDSLLRDRLAGILRDGIDAGYFRETDPERTAEFLLATLLGLLTGRATADDDWADSVRDGLDSYVIAPQRE